MTDPTRTDPAPTDPVVPDFDALYSADADPWRVGSSPYEQRKRSIVLALLGRERYPTAWDPACGTGHLVAALAERCDSVHASDTSQRAVILTEALCAGHPQVRLERLALPARPAEPPVTGFALIVLAEFLYYLPAADRKASMATVVDTAAADGEVMAVHWRHHPHDGWLAGSAVQEEIGDALLASGWSRRTHLEDPDFVCDSWVGPNHIGPPPT